LFGWNGKLDFNKGAANFEISKPRYARSLEAVGGFLSSAAGVVEGIIKSAIWLVGGNGYEDYVQYAWGANQDGWGGNQFLTWGSAAMFNKNLAYIDSSDAIKAAVGGAVAIAAAVVAVFAGGLGLAAFVPALSAATAAATSAAAIAASATLTAYFASQAAMNAYDAFSKEGIGSVSAWFNVVACLLSIAFPVKIGGAGAGAAAAAGETAVKGGIKAFGTAAINGVKGAISNAGAAVGAQGVAGTVIAWSGITQHMYAMAKLNIAMNAIGAIFGSADDKLGWGIADWASTNKDNFFAGVLNDIFSAGEGNILAMNPGQSLQFSLIMYAGMPIAQGIAGGLKAAFSPLTEAVSSKAANLAGKTLTNAVDKAGKILETAGKKIESNAFSRELAEIGQGAFEEWFKEGAIKAGLTSIGVSANAAEIWAEFLSPDGAGVNFTNTRYATAIQNIGSAANGNRMASAANSITQLFSANGIKAEIIATNAGFNIIHGDAAQSFNVGGSAASIQMFMAAVGAAAQVSKQ